MDHFANTISKKREPGTPTSLSLLIWGRAKKIEQDLAELCNPDQWEDILDEVPVVDMVVFKQFIMVLT